MSAEARKTAVAVRRGAAVACALAAAAAADVRADVRVTPRLQVEGAYTDNVRGAPKGQEEGDFFTTVTPGVSVVSNGGRVQGALNYALTAEEYLDTDELGGFSNSLLGTSRAELWDDRLFLDASASIQRVAANRRGAISATQRDLGSNQTEVFNYRVGPFLRLDLAGIAVSTTSYTFSQTIFDAVGETASADAPVPGTRGLNIGDATTHTFTQRFESGRDFTTLRWSVSATHDETERDGGGGSFGGGTTAARDGSFTQRNAIASAEYKINRYLSALGSVGYEEIEDPTIRRDGAQGELDGFIYTVGAALTGARSFIRFEAGRRFEDDTYSYQSQYRFSPRLAFNSFYSEAVTTESRSGQGAFDSILVDAEGNFVDPRTGLPFQPNDPAFDLTDQDDAFRTKTFNNGIVGSRGRNTYALSFFRTIRESLNVDREQIVTGGTITVGRQIWPQLSGDLSAAYTDTKDDAAGDLELIRLGASLTYLLAEDFTASLSYSFLDRSSDRAGAGVGGGQGFDLRENIVSVRVLKVF
jgi:uncharacterized protein (PEP-CTERM system associated)